MKINLQLILVFLFIGNILYAQEEPKLSFSHIAFAELDNIVYFQNEEDKINNRFQSLLNFEMTANYGSKSALVSSLELRHDIADPSRNRFFLDELYLDYFTKNMDIRLGRQIINWGQTDGFNALNNINPTDFSDILDTEREILPIYAARLKYYLKDFTFDFVFVPLFTPSKLPHINGSRWSPNFPRAIPNPESPNVFWQANYQYTASNIEQKIQEDFQVGLKTAYSFSGWDLAFSYYYGYNDVPKYIPTYNFTSETTVDVQLTPDYYKWHVLGLDFSTSINQLIVRGEAGVFISEGSDFFEKDPTFSQFSIGLERTFSNTIRENNLMIIVEWIQEIVFDAAAFPSNDFNHIFQRALFLRLQQDLGNYAQFTLQTVFDFKSNSFYLNPAITYEISEGFNIHLSSDLLSTNKATSFFHPYRNNDRVQLRLQYNF